MSLTAAQIAAHARRVYSEHEIGLSALIAESVQNKQPLVAHARRVYSEHEIGLSAPISAEGVQNKQPLVAHKRSPFAGSRRVVKLIACEGAVPPGT
jgi:hypothetical protein